jgi:hypothetical protein
MIGSIVVWADARDEVGREGMRTLMQLLMERMLSVRFLSAPQHGHRVRIDWGPLRCARLAVALHLDLLQIVRELGQAVIVRKHGVAL